MALKIVHARRLAAIAALNITCSSPVTHRRGHPSSPAAASNATAASCESESDDRTEVTAATAAPHWMGDETPTLLSQSAAAAAGTGTGTGTGTGDRTKADTRADTRVNILAAELGDASLLAQVIDTSSVEVQGQGAKVEVVGTVQSHGVEDSMECLAVDETKRDETKKNETKRDETKSDGTKRDETKEEMNERLRLEKNARKRARKEGKEVFDDSEVMALARAIVDELRQSTQRRTRSRGDGGVSLGSGCQLIELQPLSGLSLGGGCQLSASQPISCGDAGSLTGTDTNYPVAARVGPDGQILITSAVHCRDMASRGLAMCTGCGQFYAVSP